MAQERADQRARTTDRRFVPPSAMALVHSQVSRIFPEAVKQHLFDHARLWNTELRGKPRLISSANGRNLTIHDEKLWKEFLDKGKP
jgi:hypothetical protein